MKSPQHVTLLAREKVLVALLGELGIPVARTDLQKLLFLYCSHHRRNLAEVSVTSMYEFVPYKYGAFSFTSIHDRTRLEAKGVVDATVDAWSLTEYGKALAKDFWFDDMRCFVKQYDSTRGDKLIAETYRESPFTAMNSKIVERVLKRDPTTKRRIQSAVPKAAHGCLTTIGYQQRTLEGYFNLLLKNCVQTLCDVRHNPLSRRYGFSKKALEYVCSCVDLAYLHLPQLGIESQRRKNLDDENSYIELFTYYQKTTLPKESVTVDRIRLRVSAGNRIALTCFERDPAECHRSILADTLLDTGQAADRSRGCHTHISAEPKISVHHL